MTKPFSRAAVATSLNRAVVAWITTGLLALALLLAPHSGHGAVPSTDADVLGKWISDKNDPAMDYAVAPGPAKGTYRLMVPAKAIGRAESETVILQQTGPGEFATAKSSVLKGRFIMTGPGRAELKAQQDDKKGFHVIYQLLEKP